MRVLALDHDVTGVHRGRLPNRARDGDVEVIRLAGVGTRRWALTFRPDRVVLEVARADVVHLHDVRFMVGLVTLASRAMGRPCLVHTHGLVFHTPQLERLKRILLRWYLAPVIAASEAWVVCSSESDRIKLLEVAPRLRRRALTVVNGIDLEELLATERRPTQGLIVAIGRVTPTKAIDRLITALGRIEDIDWRLEVHGAAEADELDRLRALVASRDLSDRVAFVGRFGERDLPAILGRAAVAAFPSRAEGFGISLVEAMAAGTPVVASDIPAHRAILESVAPDGLVDFDTPAASDALRSSISTPASAGLAAALRSRARAFDVTLLVAALDKITESSKGSKIA